LIKKTRAQDANGVWRNTGETRREVFCKVSSITRAEFFDGGRNGLNPSFVFSVFHADYEGESLVEYRGETYSIYRTYKADKSKDDLSPDYIELYAQRKGGSNGE
jgi:hypothetical protein